MKETIAAARSSPGKSHEQGGEKAQRDWSFLKCEESDGAKLHICLGELKAQSSLPRGSSCFIFIHLVLQV